MTSPTVRSLWTGSAWPVIPVIITNVWRFCCICLRVFLTVPALAEKPGGWARLGSVNYRMPPINCSHENWLCLLTIITYRHIHTNFHSWTRWLKEPSLFSFLLKSSSHLILCVCVCICIVVLPFPIRTGYSFIKLSLRLLSRGPLILGGPPLLPSPYVCCVLQLCSFAALRCYLRYLSVTHIISSFVLLSTVTCWGECFTGPGPLFLSLLSLMLVNLYLVKIYTTL